MEKCCNFVRRKYGIFGAEKWDIFAGHPVLDSGRDSSGQWTVDRGTVQYGTMGHWTGHPVLDRGGSGQLDSGRDRVDRSTVPTLVY